MCCMRQNRQHARGKCNVCSNLHISLKHWEENESLTIGVSFREKNPVLVMIVRVIINIKTLNVTKGDSGTVQDL